MFIIEYFLSSIQTIMCQLCFHLSTEDWLFVVHVRRLVEFRVGPIYRLADIFGRYRYRYRYIGIGKQDIGIGHIGIGICIG